MPTLAETYSPVGKIFELVADNTKLYFVCFGQTSNRLQGMRVVLDSKNELLECTRSDFKREFLAPYREVSNLAKRNLITQKVLTHRRKLYAEAESLQNHLQQVYLATSWITK